MANFQLFSQNGTILPIEKATVSLLNIEYSYGYGVYETLKVRNGILYFVDQHLERLEHSAQMIDLPMPFSVAQIKKFLIDYLQALGTDACNLKMLLIGGVTPILSIFATAPLYPDRKLYKHGAKMITYEYERMFPTAKTLNMLPSYLAYKKAQANGSYDALLIDHQGYVREGTRTNFCLVKDKTIFCAPANKVLGGVTFLTLEKIAAQEEFTIKEAKVLLTDLKNYDGAFITSTSTKIMPVAQIDEFKFAQIAPQVKTLMKAYEEFLAKSKGILT